MIGAAPSKAEALKEREALRVENERLVQRCAEGEAGLELQASIAELRAENAQLRALASASLLLVRRSISDFRVRSVLGPVAECGYAGQIRSVRLHHVGF